MRKRDAYAGVFFEIGQHAPIAGIRKAQQTFKEGGADVIVSVGGGSPIDAAKAILYNIHKETGGPILKQIAIPTTLSAAESEPRSDSPLDPASSEVPAVAPAARDSSPSSTTAA